MRAQMECDVDAGAGTSSDELDSDTFHGVIGCGLIDPQTLCGTCLALCHNESEIGAGVTKRS